MRPFIILFVLLCLNCTANQEKQTETIKITPSDNGFDIYAPNDSLLLEFTITNSDSSELDLLRYIYQVAKEYRETGNIKQERRLRGTLALVSNISP